jgi:NAD(P)-dependent dehydrogenase (short-subunit alcohol dehydrogenase family)
MSAYLSQGGKTMRLKDKVAIITGSARGMGKTFALRFAREGANVTVCDVHDCTHVLKEIEAMGGKALALVTDISSEKDTAEMAKRTAERFGRIDILVNNAAAVGGLEIPDFMKPAEQLAAEDWNKFLEVNIKGTYLCCKAVIPYMKKQGRGNILNISSSTAFAGAPAFLHYSTSKGGILTMTKGLAIALGDFNINVNAIAPGPVMTETMRVVVSEEAEKQLLARQIFKRSIKEEDVANAVVFLASDEASMITGQTLAVNAGEYLH